MSDSSGINTQSSGARAINALAALGFVRGADGTLVVPANSIVTLAPIGTFVELKIVVDGGTEVRAILHRTALKVCRAGVKP